jgi:hypothetical protein
MSEIYNPFTAFAHHELLFVGSAGWIYLAVALLLGLVLLKLAAVGVLGLAALAGRGHHQPDSPADAGDGHRHHERRRRLSGS